MKDKVMTPGCCETCVHEERDYYEFPCNECIRDTGNSDMYLPKPAEAPRIKDSGERRIFETGAVRDCAEGKGRCDLLPLDVIAEWMDDNVLRNVSAFVQTHNKMYLGHALDEIAERHFSCKADLVLEMAIHMEEGLKKYPERNWENGISIHSFVDSGVRHYLKVLRGDDDENHLRACVWNLMCCIWTMGHKPEMDDLPKKWEESND